MRNIDRAERSIGKAYEAEYIWRRSLLHEAKRVSIRKSNLCPFNTGTSRMTTFRSRTDGIYDGGPII